MQTMKKENQIIGGNPKMKRDIFFETFTGKFVEIVQDFEITTSVNITEDGAPMEMRMPMMVTGVVLDSDNEFLFLSQDGEEVNQALPINSIKHIQIIKASDQEDQILDMTPEPEDKSGYN